MISTTGTATRTGASMSSRLTWPPAGTPWRRSTTRPAAHAAHAVTSATGRRHARLRGPVSADKIRAGLPAGAGVRYSQAPISAGPASATASVIPASSQPSPDAAASPGMTATATAAPAAAAGTAATRAARSISSVTCHSDPPRARSMASSSPRRTTSIRAASRITAAAMTIRLTDRSSSTVSMPAWVPRNRARSPISGEVTFRVSAAGSSGPVSPSVTVVARLSASASPCAWSAFKLASESGNSQFISRPGPLNVVCMAPS